MPQYDPTDRRPIRSRQSWWAQSATRLLVRLNASPNGISIAGMIAAICAGVALYFTGRLDGVPQRACWFAAGLLCQVRLLCNLLDGMVAVARNIASRKGELYNEVPDRISDSVVFIGLGYAAGSHVALGFLAALVSVLIAYVRVLARSIGAPNDFCGPLAKQQRMALVTALAAYLTFASESWRLAWGEATIVLSLVVLGGVATALRRLRRAATYLSLGGTP